MKSNTVVRINNKLMNKGITFSKNSRFEDIIQAWSFLTCFILDVLEDKSEIFELEDNSEANRAEYKEKFIEILKDWLTIANYRSDINEILEIPDE
jgi:hypothetical protein